jgi:hypothetical protein
MQRVSLVGGQRRLEGSKVTIDTLGFFVRIVSSRWMSSIPKDKGITASSAMQPIDSGKQRTRDLDWNGTSSPFAAGLGKELYILLALTDNVLAMVVAAA